MKEHIARLAASEKASANASKRIAKLTDDHAKYRAALDAAQQQAESTRVAAGQLLALAAIGEGDEGAAADAVAEADEYRAAAHAYVASLRRCLALEELARGMGSKLRVLRSPSSALELPATANERPGDLPLVGIFHDSCFALGGDVLEQSKATETEREHLAGHGLHL